MPKIIFTSRYIKSGSHGGNLVSYMATRNGVELPRIINGARPATENQRRLIDQVLLAVPDATELFEYEDYTASPTIENASAFISTVFEQNPVLWDSVRNYVEYIARRPGVQKSAVAGHGLWNDSDNAIVLAHAVDEVASHRGNLWTHVVSLRREDAERMGYANAQSWRSLVLEQLPTIAESMKIPMENLRWYAAYHDKDSNPHIHLIVYSSDPSRGYLTEPGIEKMRSAFAHSIYKDEFMHIYERKNLARKQVNTFADERLRELAASIGGDDPEITQMLLALGTELQAAKGKKQYGYLGPALKAQVDEIVRCLAADPHIDEMYRHWCELSADVKRVYTSKIAAPMPLEHEQAFKTIKNAVVRQALATVEMERVLDAPEPEVAIDDASTPELAAPPFDDTSTEVDADYHTSWSADYKLARRYLHGQRVAKDFARAYELFLREAEGGNALALHDLGYMHQHGLGVEENMEAAQVWYGKAYRAFCTAEDEKPTAYLQYRIAKLHRDGYGTAQDYSKAAVWFDMAAGTGHQYAQYSLGSLYRRGLGVAQSDAEALRLFTLSADQGNAYAAYELAGMHEKGVATEVDAAMAQRYYRGAFSGFLTMDAQGSDDKLQYRLGKMLLDGKGTEPDIPRAAAYFTKAAENKNIHAQYQLAKLILDGQAPGDRATALGWMQKSAEGGNELAQYALGKLYLVETDKDIAQAIRWLTAAAEQGNQYAEYQLGKLYLKGDGVEQDITAAVRLLTAAADQQSEYARYQLGRHYLSEGYRDIDKAVRYLTAAAGQNNQYAEYQLGKLYLKGDGVEQDRDKAREFFTASAAQGNEYAQWFIDHMDNYHGPGAGVLLRHLAQMLQQDYSHQRQRYEQAVDRKLMAKIRRKKQELGQKFSDE
ncbi:relaxase MobL [Oscillospiraceae bacterium OttesenSCG-928-G22]|nr:relaxase MobL [Oscillospiraceae bacterium OttesenSCG-928-G22]